ncbi:BamA/TamA family outer membrane protein [Vibrio sp. 10N.261.55.A7]|uniref:BamA/TamA family outer membrane protein n=1 Tax=Vibrio TaxID=662 RepID=UPI000C83FA6E|nr:BamA/TamA family outer membrane protein [Vibrio sp. 10N.261.55.A7]PMJ91894.1 glyceraldehyde-3-phosphate dehydrogenase [Vibrio sp. 10N.261.55.A7]
MFKNLYRVPAAAALVFSPLAVAVSFVDPIDGMLDMGEYLAENAYGFLPVPVLITEPALGIGGGMLGVFLHESEEEKEARKKLAMASIDGGANLIPPAVTVVGGGATENGTWFGLLGHRRTWDQDSIRYMGGLGYGNAFIDIYADIGNGSQWIPNKSVSFESDNKGYGGMQHLQFRVADTPLFLGVSQFWARSDVRSSNAAVNTILEKLIGLSSTASGLGVTAEYDTKNSFFYPTDGYSVNVEYMVYRDAIGSDNKYDTFELSGQSFHPISSDWTLAFAASYESLTQKDSGLLPPLAKPYVKLRGVSAFRYQDNYVSSIQTQLMWDIDSRWTISGFIGTGSASRELENLYDEAHAAYGAGFRYLIARRYGIRMGMDFAFSEEDNAFYFNVGSGF